MDTAERRSTHELELSEARVTSEPSARRGPVDGIAPPTESSCRARGGSRDRHTHWASEAESVV